MFEKLKKYKSLFRVTFINRLDYRQELLVSLLIGLLIFLGQYFLWFAVYQGDPNANFNGYNFQEILTYYIIVRIISELIDSRAGFRMSDLITSGQISNLLIKPINLKLWFLSEEMGRIVVDLVIKLVVYISLFGLIVGFPQIGFFNLILFTISIFFSTILTFNIYFLVGCIAFISEASGGFNYAIRRVIFFLSGGLIPVAFFQDELKTSLNFLPFKYIFEVPSNILLKAHEVSNETILYSFALQIIWIIFLWILSNKILFSFIRRNQSVGI